MAHYVSLYRITDFSGEEYTLYFCVWKPVSHKLLVQFQCGCNDLRGTQLKAIKQLTRLKKNVRTVEHGVIGSSLVRSITVYISLPSCTAKWLVRTDTKLTSKPWAGNEWPSAFEGWPLRTLELLPPCYHRHWFFVSSLLTDRTELCACYPLYYPVYYLYVPCLWYLHHYQGCLVGMFAASSSQLRLVSR